VKRRTSSITVGNFRDWSEFIDCLIRRRVRFIIVGAHALAVLGRPRHTGDLDVLVDPTSANARRLSSALRDFGFEGAADVAHEMARPGKMMQLGREPVRIDILSDITDVTFAEAWRGRIRKRVGGKTVSFLGRAEFIKNKRGSSKMPSRTAKDLHDIAMLEEIEE
jgi:hypothetical protein